MSILGAASPEPTLGQSRPLSRRAAWANLTSVSGAHAVIHATVVLMPLRVTIQSTPKGSCYKEPMPCDRRHHRCIAPMSMMSMRLAG